MAKRKESTEDFFLAVDIMRREFTASLLGYDKGASKKHCCAKRTDHKCGVNQG